MLKGYRAPFYLTYRQAQQLGGTIKKGELGTKIVYWATIELEGKAVNSNEEQPTAINNDEKQRTKLVPKAHTVFNIAQIEGIEFPTITPSIKIPLQKIEACEQVVADMPNSPIIITGGSSAYYTQYLIP